MKRIKFLGAAGTVTGSCYVFENTNGQNIMIDCGMFQGPQEISDMNYDELDCDPSRIEHVLLTHAHLDHCGRLPLLTKRGFKGRIFMTEPTRKILEIALLDAAHIAKEDTGREILYGEHDVYDVLKLAEIVKYGEDFQVGSYAVTMKDAGHILGSASLIIRESDSNGPTGQIVFSGDIGNYPQDIIRHTEMIQSGNVVVMESTYGGRTHDNEDTSAVLEQEIDAIKNSSGALLIPCFSIQRTQEIIHRLKHLRESDRIPDDIPVYIDSPMAIRVTQVYEEFVHLYNDEFQRDAVNGNQFKFKNSYLIDDSKDSREIAEQRGAKIIVAGSGMMTGGRIIRHAVRYLPEPSTRMLIVGYQGEGTLGRKITEGQNKIRIDDRDVEVRAHIRQIGSLSSHADEPKLLKWLENIKGVQKVILTHGEDASRDMLTSSIASKLGISDVHKPAMREVIDIS